MEDMNYLLKREQEELLRAQVSTCGATRAQHHGLANGYARRIRDHRLPYRTGAAKAGVAFAPYPFGGEGRCS